MIRILSSILFSFLILTTGLSASAQQKFHTTTTSTIGYLEYLPAGYDKNQHDYPVLIFLHGIGERAPRTNDHKKLEQASRKLLKNGPPKHISRGTDFPFIVISPQLKSNYGNWPVWYVMEVIEHVKKNLRIDEDRIYLSGLSLGGGGAWTVAQEYPRMFAALAPVCGGYNSPAKAKGIADADLPVWAFHGDRDRIVPLGRTERMVDAINQYNPDPKAKLTVYRGVKHDAWENAYQPGHSIHSPNLYEWLMSHSRKNSNEQKNSPPVVNAGKDLSVGESRSSLVLAGSAHDKDGKVVKVLWTRKSGSEVKLEDQDKLKVKVSGLSKGEYTFALTATDDRGAESLDEVTVIVTGDKDDNESGSSALTVSAGPDVKTSSDKAMLRGKVTGAATAYSWTQTSGQRVRMDNRDKPELRLSGLKRGSYTFQFTAEGANGERSSDETRLIVSSKKNSGKKPQADAGDDIRVNYPVASVHLKGKASSPNGGIASQQWVQVSGKRVKIRNGNTLNPQLTDFRSPGARTFKLIVKDKAGLVKVDHVRVNVVAVQTRNRSLDQDSVEVVEQPLVDDEATIHDSMRRFELSRDSIDSRFTIVVFNEQGRKLFHGRWSVGSYEDTFTDHGFYIYQVWAGPRRVHTGKLVVR